MCYRKVGFSPFPLLSSSPPRPISPDIMGQSTSQPSRSSGPSDAFDASKAFSEVPIRFSLDDIPGNLATRAVKLKARQRYSDHEWNTFNEYERNVIVSKAVEFRHRNKYELDASDMLEMDKPNPSATMTGEGLEVWPEPSKQVHFTEKQQEGYAEVLWDALYDRLAQRQWGDRFYAGRLKMSKDCSSCIYLEAPCVRKGTGVACLNCNRNRTIVRCEHLERYYVDYVSRKLNISLSDAMVRYSTLGGPSRDRQAHRRDSPEPASKETETEGRPGRGGITRQMSKNQSMPEPLTTPKTRQGTHLRHATVTSIRTARRKLGRPPRQAAIDQAAQEESSTSNTLVEAGSPARSESPSVVEVISEQSFSPDRDAMECNRMTSPARVNRKTSNMAAAFHEEVISRPTQEEFFAPAVGSASCSPPVRSAGICSGNRTNPMAFSNDSRSSFTCLSLSGRGGRGRNSVGKAYQPQPESTQCDRDGPEITIESLQGRIRGLIQTNEVLRSLSQELFLQVSDAQSMLEIYLPSIIADASRLVGEGHEPIKALVEQERRLRAASLAYRKGLWNLDKGRV